MNKLLSIFLVLILIASFTLSAMTFEPLEWADVWKTFDEKEKRILMLGTVSGNLMALFLLSEKSESIQSEEVTEFITEFTALYIEYISFYENEEAGYKIIEDINRLYTDPDNRYCNPASLAYLSWLESEGKDITKLLQRLRIYSELDL